MLAAVISLLLVILFVLLLHIYAKWFLTQSRRRSRAPVSVSQVLGPTRLHHFNSLSFDTDYPTKGLEASAIASIPLFVYGSDRKNNDLECVICLSVFEEGELGRKLAKCGHGFHVECIDMWLGSHSSCPICRAPAVMVAGSEIDLGSNVDVSGDSGNVEEGLEIVVEVPNSDRDSGVVVGVVGGDSLSACSSSSSLTSHAAAVLGGSLKRMLSRNRSERKVRLAAGGVNETDD